LDTSSISEVKRVTPQTLVLIVMASNSKRFMNITIAPRIAAPIIPMQQFKNGGRSMAKITNIEQAKAYIERLVAEGKDFHFDDDPHEVIDYGKRDEHGVYARVFTDDEADLVSLDAMSRFDLPGPGSYTTPAPAAGVFLCPGPDPTRPGPDPTWPRPDLAPTRPRNKPDPTR
jgi:hypothetical protein